MAVDSIDTGRIRFYEKVKTIHRQLLDGLLNDGDSPEAIPFRFLLSLEREIVIFLSLIGGNTAQAIIRKAVAEYGQTGSAIYQNRRVRKQLPAMMQHLRVLVRALGRIGRRQDLPLIDTVKQEIERLQPLIHSSQPKDTVDRLKEWADKARAQIIQNN